MKSKKLFFYQTVFFASLFLITPATAMDGIAIQPIKCIHNESLLRKAAQNNNPEELIRIINIGVNINHQDVLTGNTAMHYATINNYEEIAKILLKHRAHINIQNHAGSTPLHIAVYRNNNDFIAIFENSYVRKETFSNDLRQCFRDKTSNEKALFEAVKNNDQPKLNHIIKKGINVNTQDIFGCTALHWAMHKNFFDIGKILLRNGADVTIKNMTEDRADGYLSPSIKGRSPTDEEGSVQKDVFFESMLKQLLHLRLEKLAEEQQKLQAQVFFPLSKSAS